MADRTMRLGRVSRTQGPRILRFDERRFGVRSRGRSTIKGSFSTRRDSPTIDRAPPGTNSLETVVNKRTNITARSHGGGRIVPVPLSMASPRFSGLFSHELPIRHVHPRPARIIGCEICVGIRAPGASGARSGEISQRASRFAYPPPWPSECSAFTGLLCGCGPGHGVSRRRRDFSKLTIAIPPGFRLPPSTPAKE